MSNALAKFALTLHARKTTCGTSTTILVEMVWCYSERHKNNIGVGVNKKQRWVGVTVNARDALQRWIGVTIT